ncbi:hypothetical protein F5X97DRAFT_101521 [Nemania serpens]|nr:hypothetical protein F5X97DRAFT_101521 [Nemania serpens]
MGGGIKSKFKLQMPGRSGTKQQVPVVSVSGPLSKAQRILGADGINTGSSRLAVDIGRSWEAASTGGVSASISESSASQATHDTGLDRDDGRKALWEQESTTIPRQIRSAHGTGPRSLAKKRSTFSIRNESRDNITNVAPRGRRLSSSTIDTHYDSANMPLAISQQTSNSAMAKGLPTKVNELLDMDGTLAGTQTAKKKPAKLDLSRLRPKAYRDRNRHASQIEPVGINAMRSPSVMSQRTESRVLSSPASEGQLKTPRKLIKHQLATRHSPRSKGITDTTGLHQLYHHYEQMSFQDDEASEDIDEERTSAHSGRNPNKLRPASAFTHSLIAPLPLASPQGQEETRSHSRSNSHDSRVTVSVADSSGGLHAHSISTKDYAGSVSSRHTRTSKASPSNRSIVESDRLQSSILSLSDSSDDEAIGPAPVAPVSRRESVTRDAVSENSNINKSQQGPTYLHGTISPRKFKPSLNQVDEYLTIKSTTRSQNGRWQSNNTSHFSHSSVTSQTAEHQLSSAPDSRLSLKSTKTVDASRSSQQSGYEVQQARAVSMVPLVSTAKAASQTSMSEGVHPQDTALLRQNSSATSHFSHSTDQPTPPLSPNSVEFYIKSRESLQRDAMTSGSSEAHNARLMAVTRQEEMLLAALRQKRAKMRETVISESEEEGRSRIGRSGRSSSGSMQQSAMPKRRVESTSTGWPKRASSLFMAFSRENLRGAEPKNSYRKGPHDVDVPSATSRSDRTDRTSTSATGSTTSLTFDSRDDRIPLYLDQPAHNIRTADSGVDFSDDYMDDSDGEDLIANERRTSRRESRRHSPAGAAQEYRTSSTSSQRESRSHSGSRYRTELNSSNFHHAPANGDRLQDVPEVEIQLDCNEDVDADDLDEDDLEEDTIDDFPQPPMPPPSWPLPPRPEKLPAKLPATPNRSPASANFLHPASAMQQSQSPESKARDLKSKRSIVRLSAVGHGGNPVPYWGDDD